jgi:hypothetical protein
LTQLHTIVALEQSARTTSMHGLTQLYHLTQQVSNFKGKFRVYTPFAESEPEETLESTLPALHAHKLLGQVRELLARPWDLGATRDATNMTAKAPIVVDGVTLVDNVPVVTLLTLHDQLVNLRTELANIPTLSPTVDWQNGARQGLKVAVSKKPRTKKVMKSLVLHPPTKEHPAQTHAYSDDEVCGEIITTEFSGAIDPDEKDALLVRINKLIEAVKAARTVANQAEVVDFTVADELLSYVFAR